MQTLYELNDMLPTMVLGAHHLLQFLFATRHMYLAHPPSPRHQQQLLHGVQNGVQ
jgi:hypothetical protein